MKEDENYRPANSDGKAYVKSKENKGKIIKSCLERLVDVGQKNERENEENMQASEV